MATYLITGGLGFVGGHLAEALRKAGHFVRILDDLSSGRRENAPADCEVIVGDVAEPKRVADAMEGVDGCYHLAAIASVERASKDWIGCHRVNLGGAINVFDAARNARGGKVIPVVYASSAAVYGDNADMPLKETAAASPLSAYGADKLGCELHARVAAYMFELPVTGLRFFNIYGPRQDPKSPYSGVISIFADRVLGGDAIAIHGDGEQVRDFIYVADVVRYLRAAMAKAGNGARVLNVCTGRATSIRVLAETLCRLNGKAVPIRHVAARPGDIRVSIGDPAAAARVLGLEARTDLETGLGRTLEYIRASLPGLSASGTSVATRR